MRPSTGIVVTGAALLMLVSILPAAEAQTSPTLTVSGQPVPGSTVQLTYSDPQNAGKMYVVFMAFVPGSTPLPNWGTIPVSLSDPLVQFTLSRAVLGCPGWCMPQAQGILPAGGTVTFPWTIIDDQRLEGLTLHAAGVSLDMAKPFPQFIAGITPSTRPITILSKDRTPPVITISSPQGISYKTQSIPLQVSANEPIALWTYSLDGQANVTFDPAANPQLAGLAESQHTLEVFATDLAGNVGSARVQFTVDVTAPVVTITSPLNQWYTASQVQLAASANEPVSSWAYSLNSQPKASFSPPLTIAAAEGANSVEVFATDAAGNEGRAIRLFSVDTAPPTSAAGPLSAYTSSPAFSVPYTASDPTSGVASTELFYRKDGGSWVSYGTFTSSPLPFTSSGDGLYEFEAVSTDVAGNQEARTQTPEAAITVDTTPPVLTSASPVHQQTYNTTVTGQIDYIVTANEPLSAAWYAVDGDIALGQFQPLTQNTPTQWESLINTHPDLSRGQHQIAFKGKDLTGNNEQTVVVDFTIWKETTAVDCTEATSKLNGTYDKVTLVQSISDHSGTCITFGADNVIFDGGWSQGVVMDGDGINALWAVDLNGHSGNTVQSAKITEFGSGVKSTFGNNNVLINNYISNSIGDGILINRGNNYIIKYSIIQNSGTNGILLVGATSGIIGGLIENNTVRSNGIGSSGGDGNGIHITGNVDNVVIKENLIWGNGAFVNQDYGILIDSPSATGNSIYHNVFRSNTGLASDAGSNQWHNGYPSGGNYWVDYDTPAEGCNDSFIGVQQNQAGSDGICDSPYPNGIADQYPWVTEWGWGLS